MTTNIIVSYDGTDNDRDAIALGRALDPTGAQLALAYVTHGAPGPGEQARAEQLLSTGAQALGHPEAGQHVALDASTPNGLRDLAIREQADVVVFGSEYRTAAGSVAPGNSARRLLDGCKFAVAIAPAELRSRGDYSINRIGVLAEAGDPAPSETANRLATALGATIAEPGSGPVDLLVVGSRDGAPNGTVELSATAEYAIETASSPVLAIPRATALDVPAAQAAQAQA